MFGLLDYKCIDQKKVNIIKNVSHLGDWFVDFAGKDGVQGITGVINDPENN